MFQFVKLSPAGEGQPANEQLPQAGGLVLWRKAGQGRGQTVDAGLACGGCEPRKSPGIVALSAGGPWAPRAEEGARGETEGNPYTFSESNLLFSKLRKC